MRLKGEGVTMSKRGHKRSENDMAEEWGLLKWLKWLSPEITMVYNLVEQSPCDRSQGSFIIYREDGVACGRSCFSRRGFLSLPHVKVCSHVCIYVCASAFTRFSPDCCPTGSSSCSPLSWADRILGWGPGPEYGK